MNRQWPSRKSSRPDGEGGFTLVELIISIVILTMITGALSTAFVSALKASKVSSERTHESNDSQLIGAWFTRDAQATGGSDPGTGRADTTLGVSVTDAASCGSGTLVVRFKWIDQSTSPTTAHTASYSTIPSVPAVSGQDQLVRTSCVTPQGGATTTSSQVLARRIASSPAPAAWCDGNQGPPGTCPSAFPTTVNIEITESNQPPVADQAHTFTLSASVRPQGGQPDPAIPTPLVILGRPGCGSGSDDTTGLTLAAFSGTLEVFGRTYVNATDVAGNNGCAAMNVVLGATYRSGVTSLVNGGTCNTFFANPCPSAPFLTKNNPPVNDPYANLPALNPATLGLSGGKTVCASGPGIYSNLLSITSNCTLAAGVYVLHNGISISNGASLTGNGVLLYIDNGAFNANGAGAINLTGLAGNTPATAPYAGLVIWKTDASTVACNEIFNITSTNAGVCFQGLFSADATLRGVIYAPKSSVADELVSAEVTVGGGTGGGIVTQALIVQTLGEMSVGTESAIQPTITTTSLKSWTVNRPYPTTTLAATGGVAPYWWTASGLPAGLTLDGATGVISGTPTATGTTTFTISATDILGQSDTNTFSITINPAPAISTTPPDWTVGFVYDNFPMQATGGTTPFTWTASGLPTGLGINAASGVISGTPTAVGTYNATVTATDTAGASDTNSYTMHINSLPTISGPATLPSPWTQGSGYTATQITTANGTGPFTWAASGLPTGMSIGLNTGIISGTPTVAGTFSSVTVTATDQAGATATKTYSIVINGPLGLGGSLPNGEINRPYSFTVVPSGGTPPFTFSISAGALPLGLTLSAAGVISGTPTAVSAPNVTIRVRDNTNATTTKQYTLTIVAAPTITAPATLPNWTINRNYPGTQITATGGIAPFTFTISSGTLPTGLAMSAGGLITGIPTVTGSFSFVVTLTDATGFQTTKAYTIVINGLPSITTISLPGGETTLFYTTPIAATGGTTPYSWTANGVPAGLSMSSAGVLSGTPTASGVFSLNITVTDTAGASASLPFTLNIAQGPGNGTSSLPNGQVGIAYPSTTVVASGGTPPYTFTGTNMPPGLSIAAGTGIITGTPTSAGTYSNVQIKIQDSIGGAVTTTYTIVIAAGPTVATTSPLPSAMISQPYSLTLTGTGGTTPYSLWTASGLPAGLSIDPNTGVISGTPTATGTSTVIVSFKDSVGATAPNKSLSLTVTPPLAMTSMLMQDNNGNGKVDRLVVTFNATLASSSNTAQWLLNNVPSGGTLQSVSTAGAVATLVISEGPGAADTAVGTFKVALVASATGIRTPGGSQASFPATAPTDDASPVPTAVVLGSGGGLGTVGSGDTITITYSEALSVGTICTGWTNDANPQSTTATVTISNSGAEPITFGSPCANIGTVSTNQNYVSNGARSFVGSAISWTPATKILKITLAGGSGGTANNNQPAGAPTYTPGTNLADPSANTMTGASFNGSAASRF